MTKENYKIIDVDPKLYQETLESMKPLIINNVMNNEYDCPENLNPFEDTEFNDVISDDFIHLLKKSRVGQSSDYNELTKTDKVNRKREFCRMYINTSNPDFNQK
jgi:hypothetical protein